jgi:hypothetical protein
VEQLTSEQIAQRSAIKRDNFLKTTSIEGMKLMFGTFGVNSYGLSAIRHDDADQPVDFALWMLTQRAYSEGWAFWETAHDLKGIELSRLTKASDVTSNGGTIEVISFSVTRQWLEEAASHNATIRVDGKRAQQILMLPSNYVAGFLTSYDAFSAHK